MAEEPEGKAVEEPKKEVQVVTFEELIYSEILNIKTQLTKLLKIAEEE